MVNNVIDHSGGTHLYVRVERETDAISIVVMDDGEGIFNKIMRLCKLSDERQALFELSKGKLTTDPENHSGEGVFFTSRAFDEFEIDSKGLKFTHNSQFEYDFLWDSVMPFENIGTLVFMLIQRNSNRELQSVFNNYTAGPDDFQFNKTIIPVRLAQYENEKLISRSQAKRLLIRIEKFEHVIFDFEGVNTIGQAFSDEIFRVYALKNPKISLIPINMQVNVEKMVNRAIGSRNLN